MLDIRWLREHPEEAAARLAARGGPDTLAVVLALDRERRALLPAIETLRSERKALSQEVNRRGKAGEPAGDLPERARAVSAALGERESRLRSVESELGEQLLALPNLPDAAVPVGAGEEGNRVVRTSGTPVRPEWACPHWEIGERPGILDFPRASRIAGSRFPLLTGDGALLQRALTALMLEMATARGFTEVAPPLLANAATMRGSGHLPKFEEDLYKTREGLYLIPTAEAPLVSLHRDEVLDGAALPRRYVAATPCFREEAGALRKETRGLIRVHQFEKVELVSFTRPEDSAGELERLVAAAEGVLAALGIPYRVVELCTGELGFSAARAFDVEAWFPGLGRYLEVSTCSNCADFQARRCNTRFRDGRSRPRFVHTLNGSALAVGRTLAAVLENGLREDGSVIIPPALRPALGERDLLGRPR